MNKNLTRWLDSLVDHAEEATNRLSEPKATALAAGLATVFALSAGYAAGLMQNIPDTVNQAFGGTPSSEQAKNDQ